jgi:hypothetical protein
MKTKNLLLTICLLYSGIVVAQNSATNKLFDKYENEDSITFINISKAMLKLLPDDISTEHVNLKNISSKIESIRLISSEKKELKEKINADFKSLINNDKNYEELIRIKDNKTNIIFNVKKKGESISELIMLINDEKDFVAIHISGNLTLEEIQDIAKHVKTQ